MMIEHWQLLVAALLTGMLAGIAAYALAFLGVWLGDAITRKMKIMPVPAAPGDKARRHYRVLGKRAGMWWAAMLVVLGVTGVTWVLLPGKWSIELEQWGWYVAAAVLVLLVLMAFWNLVSLFLQRRDARHDWLSHRAVAAVLDRLGANGFRIFHEVVIGEVLIDHVVLGEKGIFAINTVARRAHKKDTERAAKLENGKLAFSDGEVLVEPIAESAANLRMLTAACTKLLGHKAIVRSVIALPGWNCQPDASENHMLLNETNLATLPSWNPPEHHLMQEDVPNLEKWLQEQSTIKTLD
ncbi:MAG: nuclease-related domain-containing protein [Gammaproteobacteria bacterium]|nr:nuclease-related domain-containing protein [Gammaproteobacteria bacterium]